MIREEDGLHNSSYPVQGILGEKKNTYSIIQLSSKKAKGCANQWSCGAFLNLLACWFLTFSLNPNSLYLLNPRPGKYPGSYNSIIFQVRKKGEVQKCKLLKITQLPRGRTRSKALRSGESSAPSFHYSVELILPPSLNLEFFSQANPHLMEGLHRVQHRDLKTCVKWILLTTRTYMA